jgi:hypothetical protein
LLLIGQIDAEKPIFCARPVSRPVRGRVALAAFQGFVLPVRPSFGTAKPANISSISPWPTFETGGTRNENVGACANRGFCRYGVYPAIHFEIDIAA